MNQILDHEQFEGAQVLAEIGTKIAAGRALLIELESSKEEFLNGREVEALARVNEVLKQSRELIDEIGKNHSELVGYRTQVDGYFEDVRCLLQAVKNWKESFDTQNAAILKEINEKIKENNTIIEQIKGNRALLDGETQDIARRRKIIAEETIKMNDERGVLDRAWKELTVKQQKNG